MSNLRKMTISRVENACKPLILQGLQKNIKIVSTHLLTLLIVCAILHIEQMERVKKAPHSSETPLSSESDYINILSNERRHDL